jgi:hypothetical protein
MADYTLDTDILDGPVERLSTVSDGKEEEMHEEDEEGDDYERWL